MKKLAIAIALGAGLGIGSLAGVHAKLPPAAPKSDAVKAAEAEKAKADAAKEAADLDKARDRAVANFKKNKGIVEPKAPAAAAGKKK